MEERLVLLVEDDESLRELYVKILEDAGIKTMVTSSGHEAVSLALEHHPDVIVMDVMLPDISGHDAVEKIRFDSWGKKAKVVYLTNRSDAESVSEAVSHGSDEYIIKAHVSNQEFLNTVRSTMVSE
jgi:DNA-binding response OmpR family regulator